MTPLRERIIGALALQPMPINQVAKCLSVQPETARVALNRLAAHGRVRRHGWAQYKHGKACLFEIAA